MGMSWVSDIMRYTADNGKESPGTDKPVTPLIVPAPAAAATILTDWSLDTPTIRSWQFHRVESSPYNSLEILVRGTLPIRKELMQNIIKHLRSQTEKISWSFRHIHLVEKLWNFLIFWLSALFQSPLISPGSSHPGQCPCLWSWFLCMTQSGGWMRQEKHICYQELSILWKCVIFIAYLKITNIFSFTL